MTDHLIAIVTTSGLSRWNCMLRRESNAMRIREVSFPHLTFFILVDGQHSRTGCAAKAQFETRCAASGFARRRVAVSS
jgi:hypothetical protein